MQATVSMLLPQGTQAHSWTSNTTQPLPDSTASRQATPPQQNILFFSPFMSFSFSRVYFLNQRKQSTGGGGQASSQGNKITREQTSEQGSPGGLGTSSSAPHTCSAPAGAWDLGLRSLRWSRLAWGWPDSHTQQLAFKVGLPHPWAAKPNQDWGAS